MQYITPATPTPKEERISILNSFARISLRSQGVEEFLSEETPLLLNSLDKIIPVARNYLYGVKELRSFYQKRLLSS